MLCFYRSRGLTYASEISIAYGPRRTPIRNTMTRIFNNYGWSVVGRWSADRENMMYLDFYKPQKLTQVSNFYVRGRPLESKNT